ncbi:hypothetical protein [Fodinibius salsisoli]|uniref:Pectate lyase n=1 Tax=Fodinibius salsisoli TaxID=2820877 RepID=A0ABT3PJB7_9BACT|nr:hypothetical protein [Fodinibius salsisoli]MCW9705279.1 hypothetical protein [Fodinibius salsisoli]
MKYFFISVLLFFGIVSLGPPAKAQYPSIPEDHEARAGAKMEKVESRSDSIWQEVLPTVMDQALNGRPYLPYASMPSHLPQAEIPAFPGAEGGGAYTLGGRGGKVYVVTSLKDSGPGTFREAVEAGGARIVVFNVSGIIKLKSPIYIRAPYLTIAGQSAPGDGVCIAGESVKINTHDVIVRHMRFRRGKTEVTRRDDALGGPAVGNIMIDHVSASWGLDENLSIYRNIFHTGHERKKLPTVNITIQNTISAEGLDTYNHAFGSTIGGHNSTFMRNLWANNVGRNPSVGMHGDFNFVNNVLFNWWNRSVDGGDYRSMFNIVNNYYKPGPITPEDDPVRHRIIEPERGNIDSLVWGRAYVHGNRVVGNEKVSQNNWAGGVQLDDMSYEEAQKYFPYLKREKPFPMPENMTVMPAEKAYQFVLENAGATLPRRDEVDQRIVRQVRTGEINNTEGKVVDTGSEFVDRRLPADSYKKGIIMDISQVGGYPEYTGEPYTDSDSDGMPDDWEEKYGLDPNDPSDATSDINGDGYTNIEKYINGIDPTKKVDWTDPDNNYDTLAEKGKLMGN